MKLKEKINEKKEKNIEIGNDNNKSQSNLNINLNAPSVINNLIEEKISTNKNNEMMSNKEDITLNDKEVIKPSEHDIQLYKPYEI